MEINLKELAKEVCKRCKEFGIDCCKEKKNCPVGIGKSETPIKKIDSNY